MHNLVLVKLWSDIGKAPHFEVRCLLESDTYSNLSVDCVRLFEVQHLLVEILKLKSYFC